MAILSKFGPASPPSMKSSGRVDPVASVRTVAAKKTLAMAKVYIVGHAYDDFSHVGFMIRGVYSSLDAAKTDYPEITDDDVYDINEEMDVDETGNVVRTFEVKD
jgi:hypothetical protein